MVHLLDTPAQTASSPLTVLQLAGSAESEFFRDLSLLYARDVIVPDGVTSIWAVVEPGDPSKGHSGGMWRFGRSLDRLGAPLAVGDALMAMPDADLVVPHMFCPSGMSSYRALFEDILGIPVVGSPACVTSVCTDKAKTRAIVAAAGLHVPEGRLLRWGDALPDMACPLIVKPNSTDNSVGLSLVRERAQLPAALEAAFAHDREVLVEAFIPGREIRMCVIDGPDGLFVPAMMEYPMSAESPIREVADKLDTDAGGRVLSQTTKPGAAAICPADLEAPLREALTHAAITAHKALGARHYSLYDFRVHEDTDTPYFLEAGLFWAFSRISMISRMLDADGADVPATIDVLWRRAGRVPA